MSRLVKLVKLVNRIKIESSVVYYSWYGLALGDADPYASFGVGYGLTTTT